MGELAATLASQKEQVGRERQNMKQELDEVLQRQEERVSAWEMGVRVKDREASEREAKIHVRLPHLHGFANLGFKPLHSQCFCYS